MAKNIATEELAAAHVALMKDLSKLQTCVAPRSSHSIVEVREELAAAREHIATHFESEERGGYMDAVRTSEPRFENTIQTLREEHKTLADDLEALLDRAKTAIAMDKSLAGDISKWITAIHQHEARENQLVQNAFGLDMNAED